jgi:hypothetical protein
MWIEKVPSLTAVARALLISLQAKVLIIGGINLHFQVLRGIFLASSDMLLGLWFGSW